MNAKIKLALIGAAFAAFALVALLSCIYGDNANTLTELFGMLVGFFRGAGAPAGYITVYALSALMSA
ncbi:hypothetical protein MmiEs2_04870 [Methanimicrococcus stummii]|uniref:Uncharacterized protein n=1 Tax=Methanimicrococcus stummii TaxID=3028294 RepID=A0AA96V7S4_9EURY|nr:hypothetical protein [Methanimicrococcus sp. Es2]WNY28302.1 hypothetical protein MmiEs2_04870 [Methanimicrococcus sp. Es2]